jgi:hypothetical protein
VYALTVLQRLQAYTSSLVLHTYLYKRGRYKIHNILTLEPTVIKLMIYLLQLRIELALTLNIFYQNDYH